MGIASRFKQSVTVEPYIGANAAGDLYDPPVTRTCLVDDSLKLVRNQQGDEVVSSARLYDLPSAVDSYAPGSRVTVNGRAHRVIVANLRDAAGPAAGHHVAVELA